MINIINKFFSAVITAILYCIGLAIMEYVPLDQREEGIHYFHFIELVMMYFVYAVPFTFVAGIPFSIVIEFVSTKLTSNSGIQRYLLNVMFFTLAGIVITLCFLFMVEREIRMEELFDYKIYLFCIVPSILFYHVSLILKFLTKFVMKSE